MLRWRRLSQQPRPAARNVVFLVLIAVVVALAIGAILVFGTFLDRFGT